MTTVTFEEYLAQADTFARQGDWQATLAALQSASQIEPAHPGALTGLGTCLIQLGRPVEAVLYFQKVIEIAPDSAEARNNLGVVYALAGQVEAAQAAYQQAIDLDPDHVPAWKNLALVSLQGGRYTQGAQILAAIVQAHPEDAEALFLLAQCYEGAGETASARRLYQEALKFQPDLATARQALSRLPAPPADPARIARPEHAQKLASLKALKGLPRKEASPPALAGSAAKGIIFYGPPHAATERRLAPVAQALAEAGTPVRVSAWPEPADLDGAEAFVFSRPQASPALMDALRRCARAGKRVLVDLDEDFLNLPPEHPDSPALKSQAGKEALEEALKAADAVSVPCQALAEVYRPLARRVEVIPYCWNRSNLLWDKPAPRRQTANLGLSGSQVGVKDVSILKNGLTRLLREYPQALLVIAQNLELYEAFSSISEDRRLFLPDVRLEDYPYLLANFDVLLVPLQNTPNNGARSDLPLLEAGLRRIPWVATPAPAFEEWGAGGLFAAKPGEWYPALKRLLAEPGLRQELGEAGRGKAEGLETKKVVTLWLEYLRGNLDD